MTISKRPDMILLCSDHHGQYIPQHFAQSIKRDHVQNVSDEDWAILEAGPEHEQYWDAWIDVCDSAVLTDMHGVVYSIYQDGDVWAIPDGMEWSEDEQGFVWPVEGDE